MVDRLSIKWVEGNTNGTIAEVSSDTTFNVDDPQFWTPLSVLSGLASGFCERRAVLNSTFITGTTVVNGVTSNIETVWKQESTDATDVANRAMVVSNFMNNIALGSTGDTNIYKTADAQIHPIGSAAGSNYMTAMDSAIMTVIGDVGKYVSPGATAYTTFSSLAADAAGSAAHADSAISTPVSGGGTALRKTMANALPVEWAKERKWVLESLRYISGLDTGSISELYINGAYIDNRSAGTSNYKDAYTSLFTSDNIWGIDAAFAGDAIRMVSRGADTSATDFGDHSPAAPCAIFMQMPTSEAVASCSVYLDNPYYMSGTNGVVQDAIRWQYLMKHVPTANIDVQFGESSSYVVTEGATVTFTAGVSDVDVEDVEITEATFTPTAVTQIDDTTSYTVAGTLGDCILSSGVLNSIDATAFTSGVKLDRGTVVNAILETEATPEVGSTYTNCTLSSASGTVHVDLSSMVYGRLSSGGYNNMPFYISALTVMPGGCARLCYDYLRGGVCNVYSGATIEEGTLVDNAFSRTVGYTVGGGITANATVTEVPNLFGAYCSANRYMFSFDSSYYYNDRSIIVCSGAATSADVPATTVGVSSGFMILSGGTYNMNTVNSIVSAAYGTVGFSLPIVALGPTALNLNINAGNSLFDYLFIASGCTADTYLVTSHVPPTVGHRNITVCSGGKLKLYKTNDAYRQGQGALHDIDGIVEFCTVMEGGVCDIVSTAYPNDFYIGSDVVISHGTSDGVTAVCSSAHIFSGASISTNAAATNIASGGIYIEPTTSSGIVVSSAMYYGFNPFGITTPSLTRGWNELTAIQESDGMTFFAGTPVSADAISSVENAAMHLNGLSITNGGTAITPDMNNLYAVVEGAAMLVQEGPPGVSDKYKTFYIRQSSMPGDPGYVTPTSSATTT